MTFAPGGMNSALDEMDLPVGTVARAINLRLHKKRLATRPGVTAVPLTGDSAVVDRWAAYNIQGGMRYRPARGSSALTFARDYERLMISCGGGRYSVAIRDATGITPTAQISDVSGGLYTKLWDTHWWVQAENYAISSDAVGATWIWDGENPAFASAGYNTATPLSARVPNAAGPMCYANNMLHVAAKGGILVGNRLHQENRTDARNVLEFSDQRYWATGQMFSQPSILGPVTAVMPLPVAGRNNGIGFIIPHCNEGAFGIFDNIADRSTWPTQAVVQLINDSYGAVGQYAIALFVGDQIFRTKLGIQTYKTMQAEYDILGATMIDLGKEVRRWLDADDPELLRFCSISTMPTKSRTFCTTAPRANGIHRWHDGLLSCHANPIEGAIPSGRAWEGLWTFPREIGGPVLMLQGPDHTAWGVHYSEFANRNFIVRHWNEYQNDITEDGKERLIEWRVVLGKIAPDKIIGKAKAENIYVRFANCQGTVRGQLYVRTELSPDWKKVGRALDVNVVNGSASAPLLGVQNGGRDFWAPMGKGEVNAGRWVQFRLDGAGVCEIADFGWGFTPADKTGLDADDMPSCKCYEPAMTCEDDFSYTYSEGK